MKKAILIFLCIGATLSSCDMVTQPKTTSPSDNQIDSLQSIINKKNDEVNNLMGTLSDIQEGFNQINQAQGRINILKDDVENSNNAENIKENMVFIKETLEDNKKLIEDLHRKLKESSMSTTKFKQVIDQLTKEVNIKNAELETLRNQLEEKNVVILNLGDSVNRLNKENTEIKASNENYKKITDNQDSQLNTAWYVYGTSSELKEHKILKGGDALTSDDFDKNYFTKIDIRKTTIIPLGAKNAKLYTNHPTGSYSLMKDAKGEYTLRITDPAKFWSISKYLVIRVK